MAGYSSTSGIAGTTQTSEGTGSTIRQMMEMMVKMQQAREQHAQQKFQTQMEVLKAGFPLENKAVIKTAKEAGMPIMNLKDMKAFLASTDPQKGQQNLPTGDQSKGQPLPQPTGAPSGGKDAELKGSNGKVLTGHKLLQAQQEQVLNQYIQRIQQISKMKGENDLKTAQVTSQALDLKMKAGQGDQEAVGKLMSMGEIPFNLNQVEWSKMDEQHRAAAIDMATGHETDAQFKDRSTRIGESLITSGRFSDPSTAYKAADVIAKGGELTPELKKAMKPYTASELTEQTKMMEGLVQLGVPASKLNQVARAAEAGGLENALPKGLKPIALQSLEMQKEELGIRKTEAAIHQSELQKQTQIMQNTAKKLEEAEARKLKSDEEKEMKDNFYNMVQAKKAGMQFPKEIEKEILSKYADKLGLDVNETTKWYQYVTGGSTTTFTPRVDKAALKGQDSIQQQDGPLIGKTKKMVGGMVRSAKAVGKASASYFNESDPPETK